MLPEMSTGFFSPASPLHLQDTHINHKYLESAFLYKHGAFSAGQEQQSLLT